MRSDSNNWGCCPVDNGLAALSPANDDTALGKYIARIQSQTGVTAQVLSFRKIIFRTWHETPEGSRARYSKYYTERALITLNEDGIIACSEPEYAPTEAEAAAIKPELMEKARSWPKWLAAPVSLAETQRCKLGVPPERWFVCPDLARKNVLWCQERKEEYGKDYLPWTFWNDAEWRRMEPEGKLPFWKPREKRDAPAIMMHEGAKAARYVDWLLNSTDPEAVEARHAHPWAEDLARYEHWGVMGGALAPGRTDYSELRRFNPTEAVYVCDNDRPGESALQKVSRAYRGALIGIKFDGSWPPSWDMADPMPEKLFKQGTYVGKLLEELMVPATWATDLVAVEGGGGARRIAVLRQEFKDEWAHVITPEVFIHRRWPARLYNRATEFNNRVRPYSETADTAKLLIAEDAGKVECLTYDPRQRLGYVAGPPRAFNTYQPSRIRAVPGDCGPWIDYLNRLIIEDVDRKELMRWCATLIDRPEVRMHYGVLLISETQGVGKSTLGEKVLVPLVGKENVSFPTENDILDSAFTDWKAHKRLVMVNEIYQGNSSRPYNKLKDLITDTYVRSNRKFQAAYEVENWCHMMACSNSKRALKLPNDDRRWLVPAVTEEIHRWSTGLSSIGGSAPWGWGTSRLVRQSGSARTDRLFLVDMRHLQRPGAQWSKKVIRPGRA